MKYSYRVTKYTNYNELGQLYSPSDEWTSFYDIGTKVTELEYLKVENKYIKYIVAACECLSVTILNIKGLELNVDSCSYKDGDQLHVEKEPSKFSKFISQILREEVWCKLVSDKCEFHFDYDFYMYFLFDETLAKECIDNIKTSLNIDYNCNSPYI